VDNPIHNRPVASHTAAVLDRRLPSGPRFPRKLARSVARDYTSRPTFDDTRKATAMKSGIHPDYKAIQVTCSCGNVFETRSTLGQDLQIEVCSNCHPFYTGKQKIVDTGGRVDRFRKKYAKG
jgi:large subunit ribosomal protein L31